MKELFNHLAVKLRCRYGSDFDLIKYPDYQHIVLTKNRIQITFIEKENSIRVKYCPLKTYRGNLHDMFVPKGWNINDLLEFVESKCIDYQFNIFDLLAQTARVEQGGERSE